MGGPSEGWVWVGVGGGFDPDAVEDGGGADAVAVGVGEGDAAHGTGACVVEGLESAQEVLAQAPDLAVVRQLVWTRAAYTKPLMIIVYSVLVMNCYVCL